MDPASSPPIPTSPAAELINTIEPPSPCSTIGRFADLDGVVDAGEVDVDDVTPAVGARFHRRDARVGDDDVEPAELVEPGLQRFPQCA